MFHGLYVSDFSVNLSRVVCFLFRVVCFCFMLDVSVSVSCCCMFYGSRIDYMFCYICVTNGSRSLILHVLFQPSDCFSFLMQRELHLHHNGVVLMCAREVTGWLFNLQVTMALSLCQVMSLYMSRVLCLCMSRVVWLSMSRVCLYVC